MKSIVRIRLVVSLGSDLIMVVWVGTVGRMLLDFWCRFLEGKSEKLLLSTVWLVDWCGDGQWTIVCFVVLWKAIFEDVRAILLPHICSGETAGGWRLLYFLFEACMVFFESRSTFYR